jgi:hypothetical protein
MTTSTRSRQPVVIAAEVAPARPVASVRRRKEGQYIALNGVAMVIIAAVALTSIGILYLMQTAKVAGLGYKFSHLQTDNYDLSLENSKLGYQVARYQSLDQINQVATQQLGMTPLKNFKFLQVERPANENLPPIPADIHPDHSLWDRIFAAITGQSSVTPIERAAPTSAPISSSSSPSDVSATQTSAGAATPQSTVGSAP